MKRKIYSILTNNLNLGPARMINTNEIMFAYGSDDEFKKVVYEIEDLYNISLNLRDIGDMAVKDFVAAVEAAVMGK